MNKWLTLTQYHSLVEQSVLCIYDLPMRRRRPKDTCLRTGHYVIEAWNSWNLERRN